MLLLFLFVDLSKDLGKNMTLQFNFACLLKIRNTCGSCSLDLLWEVIWTAVGFVCVELHTPAYTSAWLHTRTTVA